jgi:hypothetical protein
MALAFCSAGSDGDVVFAWVVGVLDRRRARERDGTTEIGRRHPPWSRSSRAANALAINPANALNGFGYLVIVSISSMAVNAAVSWHRIGPAAVPMCGRHT